MTADNPYRAFDRRFGLPPLPGAGQPVFLLAATWRCGSTLAQRLLSAHPDLLIWGEPYGDAGMVQALAASAAALLRPDWPDPRHFLALGDAEARARTWIANRYPPPAAARAGHRAQLDALLRAPALAQGARRFGLKEVRLGGEAAWYLQWVYPDARFLFLVRSPWDAWASYKGLSWTYVWGQPRVETVAAWGAIWARQVRGFLRWQDPAALLIRYEDLVTRRLDLGRLAAHVGLPALAGQALDHQLRGVDKPPIELSADERAWIDAELGPTARLLGYEGQGRTRAL